MLSTEDKQKIIKSFSVNESDTGSVEVQVAMLSKRISQLTDHLKTHTHDDHTRRGLLQMVGKRKRLLSYLQAKDYESYKSLISKLGLRK